MTREVDKTSRMQFNGQPIQRSRDPKSAQDGRDQRASSRKRTDNNVVVRQFSQGAERDRPPCRGPWRPRIRAGNDLILVDMLDIWDAVEDVHSPSPWLSPTVYGVLRRITVLKLERHATPATSITRRTATSKKAHHTIGNLDPAAAVFSLQPPC